VEQAGTEQMSRAAHLTCESKYTVPHRHCLGVNKDFQGVWRKRRVCYMCSNLSGRGGNTRNEQKWGFSPAKVNFLNIASA
jgi:hypothetical protein